LNIYTDVRILVKAFVDGASGTAGLRLKTRLAALPDVELLEPAEALRKDPAEIRRLMRESDFVFLCLPDAAALEAAALAEGTGARVIDTSTAHRVAPGWVYGFPELTPGRREEIRSAARVASPGCHASGFLALVRPLADAGILPPETPLTCASLTGYSGGGKKMIVEYEAPENAGKLRSPKPYALGQAHKHLPEMTLEGCLAEPPVFLPVVGDFYAGMLVTVPLHASQLAGNPSPAGLRELYRRHYAGSALVRVSEEEPAGLSADSFAGRDDMKIFVTGTDGRLLLTALFDNLGKGASGAALQCFNLMRGAPEETGLVCGETSASSK
jgi:N-acetyl-gamma-glutamyl-phosphate reductase